MGEKPNSITAGGAGAGKAGGDVAQIRDQIAETRNDMSNTIEELHGRLNPVVLKDQAMTQFHEVADTVKSELKAHFADAKEAMRTELQDAKTALKSEVSNEIEAVKTRFNEEMVHAKAAMREATIGKVENMVQGAQDKVRHAGTSMLDTVRANPIPATLIGVGLAWLLIGRRRPTAMASRYEGRAEDGFDDEIDNGQADGSAEQGNVASRGLQKLKTAAGDGAHQVSEAAQHAGRKIVDAGTGAASAANRLAHDAGTAMSSAASRVQHAGAGLGRGAMTQARRVGTQGSEMYRVNPLAVGAVVLAVGAAVALAMPRTRLEDEFMGATRDQLAERAEHLAHDAIGRAGDAAQHLTENLGAGEGVDGASAKGAKGGNGQKRPSA